MKTKTKALEPLIASILLIVVAVILVTIILAFGKGFTTDALDKTQGIATLLPSDATHFIFPKAYEKGTIQFTYSPPATLQEKTIAITSYKILELPNVEPITLTTPYPLKEGTNILSLNCLYEHALSSPDFTVQLITGDNTYITLKQKDTGMVCTSGGTGAEFDPIIICTAEDLNKVRNNLDANYMLGKNVDLSCFLNQDINGWVPIGNNITKFKGNFDGRNNTISNLYINRPATEYIGLFGHTDTNSIIQNLGLNSVQIYGQRGVGGLIGYNHGVVTNCFANGEVTGYASSGTGHANTGGLIGVNYSNLTHSSFEGNVSGYGVGSMVGGLIGQNYSNGYISNCFAKGSVYGVGQYVGGFGGANGAATARIYYSYADSNVFGQTNNVGGFVGAGRGGQDDILYSYSKGTVIGVNNIGGFIGLNWGASVFNSYSFSSVNGDQNIGGLIGFNRDFSGGIDGNIHHSYSIGKVEGNTNVGGLIGSNEGIFSYSFWDVNLSDQVESDGGEGKTTTEMKTQSTFTDWDFSTVWAISSSINDGYPYLRSNPPR